MNSPLPVLARSMIEHEGIEYALVDEAGQRRVAVSAPSPESPALHGFEGQCSEQDGRTLLVGPANAANAAALRARLPWLRARPLGLGTSAGFGDRLGLATPGHVRALRLAGAPIAPIFAQQSIREMARTGRTPQQVMDDATWGVFREGWREGVGADADHLKTTADVDACLAAGFTFYTFDPGEHVDNRAEHLSAADLRQVADSLPREVQPAATGLLGHTVEFDGHAGPPVVVDEPALVKAAVKYGRAVTHVAALYRHLAGAAPEATFEVEVSVDETEQPTSHAEHIYIAHTLRRLGVSWVSLAPRYVGRFEKGVDYLSPAGVPGDLAAFEPDFARHAAIAQQFGPYKLSLHSGSDKFSVYSVAASLTGGMLHLKTAGTSYLEALRTIAALDPAFFRDLYAFSRERYDTDRASYHVSADVRQAPRPADLADDELPALLEQFHAREILHVTFGSVLTAEGVRGQRRFYPGLMELLRAHAEAYAANLERHFRRHLEPFVPFAKAG